MLLQYVAIMANNYIKLSIKAPTFQKYRHCEKHYRDAHKITDKIKINQDDMLNIIFDNFLN
jgi:hypothetical protein